VIKGFFSLLIFCNGAVFAQQRLSQEGAIAKALQYNYDIRISGLAAEQAVRNNTIGNAGMLPDINANASVNLGRVNTETEFVDGRVQKVNNAASMSRNGAVTLNWTLFDGGRMFILNKQLNEQETIGSLQLKERIQATVSQVIQTYARVVWQHQQAVSIDTAIELAGLRMELSRIKFETGSAAKTDYLQARVDYNARRADLLNQKVALIASFAELNVLMGEGPEHIYMLDDSLQINAALTPDEELVKNNFTLDIARRSAYVSELSARIARTSRLPVLALNSSYSYSKTQSQSGFALYNENRGLNAGLNLRMPIFNGGNINRQIKIASLQAMCDQILYDKQNTETARQYRTTWSNYATSVDAYKLELENLQLAKENLDIQKARFRAGIANTLETREAENSYVQALVRYYTSIYNVKLNETILLELQGRLVN
jgi:outer membrane protein